MCSVLILGNCSCYLIWKKGLCSVFRILRWEIILDYLDGSQMSLHLSPDMIHALRQREICYTQNRQS